MQWWIRVKCTHTITKNVCTPRNLFCRAAGIGTEILLDIEMVVMKQIPNSGIKDYATLLSGKNV